MTHPFHRLAVPGVSCLALLAAALPALAAAPKDADIARHVTPGGVEYGTWGGTADKPAPTLILLSGHLSDSFTKMNFLRAGAVLVPEHGYLCVSIDLPNHGKNARKGYSNLTGWGKRAAAGDDFVAEFNERMKKVIDHLIAQGVTDPDRIVATGTSRGGFLAIRYLAFDSRVKAAVAYAPVTDLRRLKEFDVAKDNPAVDDMSLEAFVPQLVGKPILIFIGDRDDRVGTDAAFSLLQKLSAAAVKADVPTNVELRILSEPRGHSLPDVALPAARWIYRVLEGKELPSN